MATQQQPNQDIFTKISDPSDKARLFLDLAAKRGEVISKVPDPRADVFVLMAYDYSNQTLHCKVSGASTHIEPTGSLVLTFFIGGEKYFFQTTYKAIGDIVSIACQNPLFHLQRREDYRIKIPINYKALLEINSVNAKTSKKSIPIIDLSGGGCRIHIDTRTQELQVNDTIRGHLFLPDRNPIDVNGSIRHIRQEVQGKGPMVCGIQFVGQTDIMKNRIIAVVMDLYRELFAGRG